MAAVVGTWPFSLEAVKSISDKLKSGSGCIDALEVGINGNFFTILGSFQLEHKLIMRQHFVCCV